MPSSLEYPTYIEVLWVYPVVTAFRGQILTARETGIQYGLEWMGEYTVNFSRTRYQVVKDGSLSKESDDRCNEEFGGRYVGSQSAYGVHVRMVASETDLFVSFTILRRPLLRYICLQINTDAHGSFKDIGISCVYSASRQGDLAGVRTKRLIARGEEYSKLSGFLVQKNEYCSKPARGIACSDVRCVRPVCAERGGLGTNRSTCSG